MGTESTCWTLIRGAADGDRADRETFAHTYLPVVRAYLRARWHQSAHRGEVEDATQDVLVECFREDGALKRIEPGKRAGGFRAFLQAVTRNVARRAEERRLNRREQAPGSGFDVTADEASLSSVFDHEWTLSLLDQAVELFEAEARDGTEHAVRRADLLRLRFREELSMREIARRFDMPEGRLHYHYKQAIREFRTALRKVLDFHHPGDAGARDSEVGRLRALIGDLDP